VVAIFLDLPHFLHVQHNILHQSALETAKVALATVGLVQSWFNMTSLNTPGWSLSTEAFFYAVFPLAGASLWKLRDRLVFPAAFLLYSAGNVAIVLLFRDRFDRQDYFPLPHLYVFLLGILLAKVFVRIGHIPSQARHLQQWAPAMLILAVLAILLIPITGLDKQEALLQHGLLAPVFAVAILGFASGSPLVTKLFSRPWLVLLGEASYALYLIHYPIHSALRKPLEQAGWVGFAVYLVVVVGLSVLSYIYLEGPSRRWILSRVHVRSRETAITSSLSQ
jgi:peptidoglycan/LPS O-acetylase OafA/YrhL